MFIYWIHYPYHSDILSQGYIGVTNRDPNQRLKEHKMGNNNTLKNALKKNEVILDIILEANAITCLSLEKTLRSNYKIGWNIATGGGDSSNYKPCGPKKANKKTKLYTYQFKSHLLDRAISGIF